MVSAYGSNKSSSGYTTKIIHGETEILRGMFGAMVEKEIMCVCVCIYIVTC
jgi:hypothetical protein